MSEQHYRTEASHHAELADRFAIALLDDPHNEGVRDGLALHSRMRDTLRQQADAIDPRSLWVRPRNRAWVD